MMDAMASGEVAVRRSLLIRSYHTENKRLFVFTDSRKFAVIRLQPATCVRKWGADCRGEDPTNCELRSSGSDRLAAAGTAMANGLYLVGTKTGARSPALYVGYLGYPKASDPCLMSLRSSETAAMKSASWGRPDAAILAENFSAAGYATRQAMILAFMQVKPLTLKLGSYVEAQLQPAACGRGIGCDLLKPHSVL